METSLTTDAAQRESPQEPALSSLAPPPASEGKQLPTRTHECPVHVTDTVNGHAKPRRSQQDMEISPEEFLLSLADQKSDENSCPMPPAKEVSNDITDAWGFGGGSKTSGSRFATPVARMPVEKDSEVYNMNHRRRGVALILNHKNFDPRLGLKTRNGTDADRDNLEATLRHLDFEVRKFDDLRYSEVERLLREVSAEDHGDSDCILVAVLSHGELGVLYSSDTVYKPDKLWSYFNAEHCPSLAGKPKLFFIQACQGDQLDDGVHLRKVNYTETDSGSSNSYKIPTHADFLIAYSTVPGFYSWRNTTAGSWFIQALCIVLQRYGTSRDLLSNMTRVSRMVAFDFQSNTPGDHIMHEKKQIPCISSMLTRDIYFCRKA